MSTQQPRLWERVAAHPWRAALAAFVFVYCPLLGYIFSTTEFSGEAGAQHRIEQIMNRPPAPPPPLPVLKTFERLDLVMQRDPLLPLAGNLPRPKSGGTIATEASDAFHFVTSYQDGNRPCVVSRDGTDQLARFCIGDKIGDGTIEHIDRGHVTINASGQPRVVEIAPLTLGR